MSLVEVGEELGETTHILNLPHGTVAVTSEVTSEPSLKRIKIEEHEPDHQMSVKQILFNINKAICIRLDSIENKLENLTSRTKKLEDTVGELKETVRCIAGGNAAASNGSPNPRKASGAVIVGLPQPRATEPSSPNMPGERAVPNLGPNVTLITLNSEEDFPNGTWLGDENNPEMRVRVPVSPSDLLHIHSNCRTPEKMALTLLDYLFDRETQAMSNLSGTGKHGKRQLDPLLVYGIRCHLIHRFSVSEQDWHRIKLNIDSKCRTAFRRRMRGLPLTVKGFRGLPGSRPLNMGLENSSDDSLQHGELQIAGEHMDLSAAEVAQLTSAQLIQNSGGEIQVLHATPEQVAQLQQTHQIQILQGEQVLGQLHSGELSAESIQVAVSLAGEAGGDLQIIGDPGAEDEAAIHMTAEEAAEAHHVAQLEAAEEEEEQ